MGRTVKEREMSNFIEVITVLCFIVFLGNLISFVASKEEKAVKPGIACIILLIVLFLLDVEIYLRDILETLNKIVSIIETTKIS